LTSTARVEECSEISSGEQIENDSVSAYSKMNQTESNYLVYTTPSPVKKLQKSIIDSNSQEPGYLSLLGDSPAMTSTQIPLN
jgi:hypothetical protein